MNKIVTVLRWIVAVFFLICALVCFASGVLGGIIVLIAAFLASPLAQKLPKLGEKNVLQMLVGFVLLFVGILVNADKTKKSDDLPKDSTESIAAVSASTESMTETAAPAETTASETITTTTVPVETTTKETTTTATTSVTTTTTTATTTTKATTTEPEPLAIEAYNPSSVTDFVVNGAGDNVIGDFDVNKYAIIHAHHDGSSNFIVHYSSPDGGRSYALFNEIGYYEGYALINESGTYELEVEADGNWTIEALPLSVDLDNNESRIGSGRIVTPIIHTENRKWTFTHDGDSNFIVHIYNTLTGERDLLVNEIGTYNGTVKADFNGDVFFEIEADGNWSLNPQ